MLTVITVLVVVFGAAKAILKGYRTEPILLFCGILLMTISGVMGWGDVLPSNVVSTNLTMLDPFRYIQFLMGYRAGALGLMIMSLVGFAEYMTHIGADKVIVNSVVKPLSVIKSKSVLLFLSYLIGSSLQLAVPSATALAVLLMVTLYPIMVGLGISRGASAAVIASTLALTYTPLGVDAIRASDALNMELMDYVINWQAPTSAIAVIFVGLTHVFWQKYNDSHYNEESAESPQSSNNLKEIKAPKIYAILPILPVIFAVVFSGLFVSSVNLDVTTIVFISMFISMMFELARHRSVKMVLNGFSVFMKGMGNAFSSVVFLLVSAGVFAYGIQCTGAINLMIESAKAAGMPFMWLTLLFALVVGAASIVMGSGNAAFLSFVEIIPSIAKAMGADPISIMLPVQQASALGRAASPVAACVIVSAGGAGLSTFDVVRRTSIPVLVGFLAHFAIVLFFV